MISVRFKDTFRERLPEWISSFSLMGWGIILLTISPLNWQQEYFNLLEDIATQRTWGIVAITLGLLRIIALVVNGVWRPTAHLRALGALGGVVVWMTIFVSYFNLEWNPPSMAIKAGMVITDLVALWYAAGDAKLADIKATKFNDRSNNVKFTEEIEKLKSA